jgi:hypothetical protein
MAGELVGPRKNSLCAIRFVDSGNDSATHEYAKGIHIPHPKFLFQREFREWGKSRIHGPSDIWLGHRIFPVCYHSACLNRVPFRFFD